MANLVFENHKKTIDYRTCYEKAKKEFELIYEEICEIYLLNKALCDCHSKSDSGDSLFTVLTNRCEVLYNDGDALREEFSTDVFD